MYNRLQEQGRKKKKDQVDGRIRGKVNDSAETEDLVDDRKDRKKCGYGEK